MRLHPERFPNERVVLDASVLLSQYRRYLVAAAHLGYYRGYWSTWIVAEFVRKRTEWIAERAARERCDRAETRRRLRQSRQRLNHLISDLSRVLASVDYSDAPATDLAWLVDQDDWPVMQTALAASADVLLTQNSADFPLGERRNGVLILAAETFLSALYTRFPEAETAVTDYLGR